MRLLFIHEVDWLNKPIFEMHEFPEYLASRGHDVTFVDYAESLPGQPTVVRRLVAGRSLRGARLQLITLRPLVSGIPGRVLAVLQSFFIIRRVIDAGPWDAVITYAVPTNGWSAVFWARRRGIPVVYRAIDVSHRLRQTKFWRIVRKLERYVTSKASHVSTHNSALLSYLSASAELVLRSSIDYPGIRVRTDVSASEASAMRRRLGLREEERVILYRGTVYRFSGLRELIKLLGPLMRRRPDVKLVVVGGGEGSRDIQQVAQQWGLAAALVEHPFVHHDELGAVFAVADVTVNPFLPSLVTNCALPGRVLQSLVAGTPCVSTPLEGLRSALLESPALRFRPLDQTFVDAIEVLLSPECDRAALRVEARRTIGAKCDWMVAGPRFEQMLCRLVESS